MRKPKTEAQKAKHRTHGLSKTGAYKSWGNMMGRCYDSKAPSFPHYGGRGIKVCERWHDVRNFYEDMGERPSGCSIDRIDSDGDYTPENCRWVSRAEQSANQRHSNQFIRGGR